MKHIFLLLFISFFGCITAPDFITNKIKKQNELEELKNSFTVAQKKAIAINDSAMLIFENNYSNIDSLPKIIELLELALTKDSTNKAILSNYMQFLIQVDDTLKLLNALEHIVTVFPDNAKIMMLRGALLNMQDLESLEAKECFNRAKVLYDKDGDTIGKMYAAMLAEDEESKKPQFKSNFIMALKLDGSENLVPTVENFNRVELLRFFTGKSSIYDKDVTIKDESYYYQSEF